MTELWFRLNQELNWERLPNVVYGELEGPGIEGSQTIMVPAGPFEDDDDWHKVWVPGGRYFVYLTLPSGQRISTSIDVPSAATQPAKLPLEIPRSAHEHLSWSQFLGATRTDLSRAAYDARQSERSAQEGNVGPGEGARAFGADLWTVDVNNGTEDIVSLGNGLTLRIGAPEIGFATYMSEFATDEESDLVCFQPREELGTSAEVGRVGRSFLRLHRPPGSDWFVALPIPWRSVHDEQVKSVEIAVLMHWTPGEPEPTLSVILHDWLMGPLLGYLRSGQVAVVDLMLDEFLADVRKLHYDVLVNPYAAAAAGLVLLKLQSNDHLRDWPSDLAFKVPWLPDGAVIAGWCAIRGISPFTEEVNRLHEAKNFFLSAAQRGVPIYTEALHLLVDGLRLCLSPGQEPNAQDQEVEQALLRMRELVLAADPRETFTVLTSESPAVVEPPRERGLGAKDPALVEDEEPALVEDEEPALVEDEEPALVEDEEPVPA